MDWLLRFIIIYSVTFLTIEYVAGKNWHAKNEEFTENTDKEREINIFGSRSSYVSHQRYPRRAGKMPSEFRATSNNKKKTKQAPLLVDQHKKLTFNFTTKPKPLPKQNVHKRSSSHNTHNRKINNNSNKKIKLVSNNNVKPKLVKGNRRVNDKPGPTKSMKSRSSTKVTKAPGKHTTSTVMQNVIPLKKKGTNRSKTTAVYDSDTSGQLSSSREIPDAVPPSSRSQDTDLANSKLSQSTVRHRPSSRFTTQLPDNPEPKSFETNLHDNSALQEAEFPIYASRSEKPNQYQENSVSRETDTVKSCICADGDCTCYNRHLFHKRTGLTERLPFGKGHTSRTEVFTTIQPSTTTTMKTTTTNPWSFTIPGVLNIESKSEEGGMFKDLFGINVPQFGTTQKHSVEQSFVDLVKSSHSQESDVNHDDVSSQENVQEGQEKDQESQEKDQESQEKNQEGQEKDQENQENDQEDQEKDPEGQEKEQEDQEKDSQENDLGKSRDYHKKRITTKSTVDSITESTTKFTLNLMKKVSHSHKKHTSRLSQIYTTKSEVEYITRANDSRPDAVVTQHCDCIASKMGTCYCNHKHKNHYPVLQRRLSTTSWFGIKNDVVISKENNIENTHLESRATATSIENKDQQSSPWWSGIKPDPVVAHENFQHKETCNCETGKTDSCNRRNYVGVHSKTTIAQMSQSKNLEQLSTTTKSKVEKALSFLSRGMKTKKGTALSLPKTTMSTTTSSETDLLEFGFMSGP